MTGVQKRGWSTCWEEVLLRIRDRVSFMHTPVPFLFRFLFLCVGGESTPLGWTHLLLRRLGLLLLPTWSRHRQPAEPPVSRPRSPSKQLGVPELVKWCCHWCGTHHTSERPRPLPQAGCTPAPDGVRQAAGRPVTAPNPKRSAKGFSAGGRPIREQCATRGLGSTNDICTPCNYPAIM